VGVVSVLTDLTLDPTIDSWLPGFVRR
jgi:hypothetical protein